jgi:hypothetical protein
MKLTPVIVLTALSISSAALAQPFAIDWHTIEGGGQTQGGTFTLYGVIGQPDAGPTLTGGTFTLNGGFLAGATAPACPADLDDGSGTGTPDGGVTIDDLVFFVTAFSAGSTDADLDDDGIDPASPDGGVTIDDLIFFLAHFAGGC